MAFRLILSFSRLGGYAVQAAPTVFLVDDDQAALASTRWLLESAGYDVETYTSAAEYLDAHDSRKPGCVVLDFRMPKMDGLELQRRLVSAGEHIPIIFVSGYGDIPTCVEAMKAGAVDFLEKPVDGDLLLELVRGALEDGSKRPDQGPSRAEIETRVERLSIREREIMGLLCDGKSMKKIAIELGITVQTVSKHRAHILEKMKVDSDAELVRILMTDRLHES
jgi:FixJ family two-component response regulator